ncbi:MAG: J domain-containing protein [Blastocatellia bacterium]
MNQHHSDDPYKILSLDRGASEAEVRQAYFALVREHSPETDPEGFKRIRAAYEKLRSGRDRAETDLFLVEEGTDAFDPSKILRSNLAASPITPEGIVQDALALEAHFLLEDLYLGDRTDPK